VYWARCGFGELAPLKRAPDLNEWDRLVRASPKASASSIAL
jgi:hypothetical protein